MKTKDLILIGGLLAGGYLLYKNFLQPSGRGAGGGGGYSAIPTLTLPPIEITIQQEEGTGEQTAAPKSGDSSRDTGAEDVYFLDYGQTAAPKSSRILVPAEQYKYNKNLIVPKIPTSWTPSFKQSIRKLFPPAIIQ